MTIKIWKNYKNKEFVFNKDSISYTLKYETELKQFSDKDTTVAALYKEMPKVQKSKIVYTS